MKKQITGLIAGGVAGVIDVVPMILQGLTWDANLAAFSMWVVIGLFIASVDLKINPVLKGILVAFLVLLPSAILIGWKEPASLIPISVMTLILGGLLGFAIHKITGENK
ncbi:MAG: hypothetical protein GXO86_02135 [Chlorobi bacterium]|nr:hypothetical protein [Chlorobiota bacterium]